jgi:hypothetical protein
VSTKLIIRCEVLFWLCLVLSSLASLCFFCFYNKLILSTFWSLMPMWVYWWDEHGLYRWIKSCWSCECHYVNTRICRIWTFSNSFSVMAVFWVVTPCRQVRVCQCLSGPYDLRHCPDDGGGRTLLLRTWYRWWPCTSRHGATTQKTAAILVLTAVRTSDPTVFL